jgi:hypothetical protein
MKIEKANVTIDEYEIICTVSKDSLLDFIDIIKNEIEQWNQVQVIVSIKKLICIIDGK